MIQQSTTWFEVEPLMYVLGTDGSMWRVESRAPTYAGGIWTFKMINRQGQWVEVAKSFDDAVTVVVPTFDDAEATVLQILAVTGIQRRVIRMEDLATHPDNKWRRAHIAAHLLSMHHVSVSPSAHAENHDITDLIMQHNLAHASPGSTWVPHVHLPLDQL